MHVCESLQEEEDKFEQQICSIIATAKKTTIVTPASKEVLDLQIPSSSYCCCGCWCAKKKFFFSFKCFFSGDF